MLKPVFGDSSKRIPLELLLASSNVLPLSPGSGDFSFDVSRGRLTSAYKEVRDTPVADANATLNSANTQTKYI